MTKKITVIMIIILLVSFLSGCQKPGEIQYTKYSDTIYDTFDTLIQVIGYTENEEEFKDYVAKIQKRFTELHQLFDIYNDYEGINNIKTINDNAGIKPVKVDDEIIDLILFSKKWYEKTGGKANIAMGPVLEIWHKYREEGEYDPLNAKIPPMDILMEAQKHTDIEKVIVDKENSTVYLQEKDMSLDVGAAAKGFATEIVAQEIMKEGFASGIISAGGNIRVLGKPMDNIRERWGIGIQDPEKMIVTEEQNLLDTVFINNSSVVTSGDYQRYYYVDDKRLHHLIDPETLMPGEYYRAVTLITEDSGIADFLSTTAFLMPYEESRELIEGLDGVEALWVMYDGTVEATEGMKNNMRSHGATASEDK